MHALSASDLLKTWERGFSQTPVQRGVELLSAVFPTASRNWLIGLSIGQRNAHLLALREQLFGPEMAGVTVCPRCGGSLDLTLNTSEMLLVCALRREGEELTFERGGYEVHYRHPSSGDLAAAIGHADRAGARQRLLNRCLVSIRHAGVPIPCDRLPREVADGMSQTMGETDPLADIQLAVSCPACDCQWSALFDIVPFLWREIENLAGRLLRDVHALASAYGWRENDILALSPVRRNFYITALGA